LEQQYADDRRNGEADIEFHPVAESAFLSHDHITSRGPAGFKKLKWPFEAACTRTDQGGGMLLAGSPVSRPWLSPIFITGAVRPRASARRKTATWSGVSFLARMP